MAVRAQGTLDQINTLIDSREALTALVVGLVSTVAAGVWAAYRRRRRVTWQVLYDEPINKSGIDVWTVTYDGATVENASLVVIEVRNAGTETIAESRYTNLLHFTFPNRTVKDTKLRNNDDLRETYNEAIEDADFRSSLSHHTADQSVLPRLPLNPGEEFQLVFLLSQAAENMELGEIRSGGKLLGFRKALIKLESRRRRTWIAVTGGVLTLLAGAIVGVSLANRALTPTASCADGHLTIEGSTAFAPIANQVADAFNQSCPAATFAVTANGSGTGFADLVKHPDPATIAFSDGVQSGDGSLHRRAIGVVYFAVIVNKAVPSQQRDPLNDGLTSNQLRDIFNGTGTDGFTAIGRTSASGTGAAFKHAYLSGGSAGLDNAKPCDAATPARVCTVDTSLDVLNLVNKTPGSIGFVEADAVPYYTGVSVIKVDDYLPTRANVLSDAYKFVAPEYLYTAGSPAGLTADYIDFLTGDAMVIRLRDHAYIACGELGGSKISGECSDSRP